MIERLRTLSAMVLVAVIPGGLSFGGAAYQIKPAHPRLLIEDVPALARRCDGALAEDYRVVKQRADAAVDRGALQFIANPWSIPEDLMNCRDALTQKLFIALAIKGAGTTYEADAVSFLDSWNQRIPAECIPAFNRMGGVWSESYGHGAYGPVTVIPYAFHAWRTATGIDLFRQIEPWGYPLETPRWVAYTMMPHNDRTAWIDDGDGSRPGAFARAAPMLRDGFSQWFSERGREWLRERWQRVACTLPSIPSISPDSLPLGYLFAGAGHVYMRSAWNDPNATWAFFGCGPQYAGHARDDEGHFLICKRGALVSRQGGQGHNDSDPYAGGSPTPPGGGGMFSPAISPSVSSTAHSWNTVRAVPKSAWSRRARESDASAGSRIRNGPG